MKKISLLLSLASIICITSCANKNNSNDTSYSNPQVLTEAGTYPIINEEYKGQVTLKIMGASNAAINPDWSKNKFFIRMSELTGVNFDFQVYGDDMYTEKKGLALSTGNNLPDIFIKANFSNYDEVTYGGKTIISLNKLIDDYAPNLKKILNDNPIIKKSITTVDGNIYALPTIYLNLPNNATTNMRGFFWINQSWMNDLSLTMPTTPDEFLNVLRKFKKEKCLIDDSYPLVIAGIDDLLKIFNFFGMDLTQYWVQGNSSNKLDFCPQTEEFKECLAFIKTMVNEGLMNSDWSATTPTQVNAKGSSGDYYGCFIQAAPQYVVGFDKMKQYTTLNPISTNGNDGFWGANYPVQRGCFAITSACKYPEAAIRFIDSLYDISSPYGLWSSIGQENQEWKWLDESKTAWKSTVSDQNYSEVMATTIIQTGDGMPYAVDESFYERQQTDTDLYTRPLRNKQMQYGKVSYPNVYFNKTELREISDLATDINNYVNRYIANTISGSKNLSSDWDNFKEFKRIDLDRYLQILQGRYDDFYNSIK